MSQQLSQCLTEFQMLEAMQLKARPEKIILIIIIIITTTVHHLIYYPTLGCT